MRKICREIRLERKLNGKNIQRKIKRGRKANMHNNKDEHFQ